MIVLIYLHSSFITALFLVQWYCVWFLAWLYDLNVLVVCLYIFEVLVFPPLTGPAQPPFLVKYRTMSPSSDKLPDSNVNPPTINSFSTSVIPSQQPTPAAQHLDQNSALSYANSVRFGMAQHHSPDHDPTQGGMDANSDQRPPADQDPSLLPNPEPRAHETPPQGPAPPRVPSYVEELIALCLLAKLWGEILPITLIIAKTKLDWKHVKGRVEYIDLGNG